ncbi:hypothetical protein CRG98_017007 [Punica granatum]|uniref:Uncharacterized protein n=1 Tax=Punica granatum TaxID=22663 RepID=A0A2I0K201_PUNGR|nr:hypothetical protein CRG98_017007 [Punica granatum]
MSWHEMKGHLNDFGYKEPNIMWYLLPESSLDDGLVDINTDPEVMSIAEAGLKYEIVTMYTKADRMEDSDDNGMEVMIAGDVDEDDTNDDVWEAEDGEEDETERDDSDIGGYRGVSDGENKELTQVREKRQAFKMQTEQGMQRHRMRSTEEQADRQSNDVDILQIPIDHSGEESSMGKGRQTRFKRLYVRFESLRKRKRMKMGMDEHVVQEAMNEHAEIPSTGEQASPSELPSGSQPRQPEAETAKDIGKGLVMLAGIVGKSPQEETNKSINLENP